MPTHLFGSAESRLNLGAWAHGPYPQHGRHGHGDGCMQKQNVLSTNMNSSSLVALIRKVKGLPQPKQANMHFAAGATGLTVICLPS